MKDTIKIKDLAHQRLNEAEILNNNSMTNGAFYLSGYSVELMLKAKICERFDFPNLFDEDDISVNSTIGIGDIRKALKIHNLYALLIYSGLKQKFETKIANDKAIAKVNSLLFDKWSENVRYKSSNQMSATDVKELINLLKQPNGLLEWIEKN